MWDRYKKDPWDRLTQRSEKLKKLVAETRESNIRRELKKERLKAVKFYEDRDKERQEKLKKLPKTSLVPSRKPTENAPADEQDTQPYKYNPDNDEFIWTLVGSEHSTDVFKEATEFLDARRPKEILSLERIDELLKRMDDSSTQ